MGQNIISISKWDREKYRMGEILQGNAVYTYYFLLMMQILFFSSLLSSLTPCSARDYVT
jgi:hypothetical protein